jgi:hypothetical protein
MSSRSTTGQLLGDPVIRGNDVNFRVPQSSAPFVRRPWILAECAVVAAIQIWAFADNVISQDWFLAMCFAVTSLVFVGLTGVLPRLRGRALHAWSLSLPISY